MPFLEMSSRIAGAVPRFDLSTPLLLVSLLLPLSHADAAEFEMSVEGHDLAVIETDEGQSLTVDGEPVLTDTYISVEMAEVAGVSVALGISSAGGNACEGAPFVLVLAPGEAVRLDGPIDTCSPITPDVEDQQLVYAEPAVPGQDSRRWSWTPQDGFSELSAAAFTPDAAKGWEALASDEISHPAEILGYDEPAAEVDRLLGPDREEFFDLVTGIGSAERLGDLISGSACLKADCPDNAALLVADPAEQRVYLAWKPYGSKIVVRPSAKSWPEPARRELRKWAASWN